MRTLSKALVAAALASALVFAGCETEPASGSASSSSSSSSGGSGSQSGTQSETQSSSLSISPTSAIVSNQQRTKTFTVTGGSGSYTWQLATSAYGSLNRNTGTSVTYTSRYSGEATVTDNLTVRDALGGETATAIISHQPYAGGDTINVRK